MALLAGVAGAGAGGWLGWRVVPDGGAHAWAAVAVGIAVVFVAANWEVVGGSVVLERDPGLYANAARWIDGEGSLAVDARVGPFADAAGLTFVSVGMYDLDDSTLEFQSNHLTPVLFATGYGAAGAGGMQRVPLVLVAAGLLAVYALAVRMTGRAWAAAAAVAVLAASLPILGVARDTLSEPVVLLLLWSGLWLWTVAADRDEPWAALAAGVCLGACVAARIDSAAYLVPIPVVLALHGRRQGWRLVRPLAVGLVPGIVAAVLDVGLRSRGYLGDLEVEVALLYALLVVATVAGVVVARWRRPVRLPARTGAVVAVVVVGLLVVAWFVRPHVQTARARDSDLVSAIQAARGDDVDGRRRYHEDSMVWQAWYLGPVVLAAAIAGAGLLVRRMERALLLPALALGAGTALYLFRPAIAPDHLWAMRRFVPAALPLWCVLAALALVVGVERLGRLRVAVAVVAVAVAVAPVVARTWPVRAFREQDGFLTFVERTCDVVGPDAAVVTVEGTRVAETLTQTLRSWCHVPVAIASPSADLDELGELWADEDRQLWVLADVPEQLPDGEVVVVGEVANDRQLEKTLTSPPDDYFTHVLGLTATRVAGG